LSLPVAQKKLEGPAVRLTFLGFELDTLAMEVGLSKKKLWETQTMVSFWLE